MFAHQSRQSSQSLIKLLSVGFGRCSAGSQLSPSSQDGTRMSHSTSADTDYAFEMACSNIRYGEGVTQEVGKDFKNLGCQNVCVMTDAKLATMSPVHTALESMEKSEVKYRLYDKVRVEPTDASFQDAIQFAKNGQFDAYLAVGGGSVMDTCKAANLYATDPSAEFLDYVNAPIGKGLPVMHQVRPLIAVPTTAGTGSETTGAAIFDYHPLHAKTGIASRALRPMLGIVDPLHTKSLPESVASFCGFDVLCHALESYTNISYTERSPQPTDPKDRPAYQGRNPISDIWSRQALRMAAKYLKRAVYDPEDTEARSAMHLASCYAGIGFGNAGVHLCHGMSYPIAGLVKKYTPEDGYSKDHPIVPHGLSVVITAPAVFEFTGIACPDRHLEGAQILGADISRVKSSDAGRILADTLRQYMYDMKIPDGIGELGYTTDDIPALVKGTMPQTRVTKLSPRKFVEDDLAAMLESSMKNY